MDRERIWRSLAAGVCGSVAHSGLMFLKSWIGWLPSFHPYEDIQQALSDLVGSSVSPVIPWALSFLNGRGRARHSVRPPLSRAAGPQRSREGVVFGVFGWIAMGAAALSDAGSRPVRRPGGTRRAPCLVLARDALDLQHHHGHRLFDAGAEKCRQGRFRLTDAPIDATRCLFDPMSYPSSLTMRLCRHVFAATLVFLATPLVAEPARPATGVANDAKPQEPDTDIFALMSGKCSTLKIAGRDFACKTVGFFHSEEGRTNFTIAVDDPADSSHVISFSGENGRRDEDNLYELPIDRMLLSSKDRPKADGLPVPAAEARDRHMPAGWKLRAAAGLQHCLQRNGQERQEIRSEVRIRRLADDLCAGSGNIRWRRRSRAPSKASRSNAATGPRWRGCRPETGPITSCNAGTARREIALARAAIGDLDPYRRRSPRPNGERRVNITVQIARRRQRSFPIFPLAFPGQRVKSAALRMRRRLANGETGTWSRLLTVSRSRSRIGSTMPQACAPPTAASATTLGADRGAATLAALAERAIEPNGYYLPDWELAVNASAAAAPAHRRCRAKRCRRRTARRG